jgi:hypothetical protein
MNRFTISLIVIDLLRYFKIPLIKEYLEITEAQNCTKRHSSFLHMVVSDAAKFHSNPYITLGIIAVTKTGGKKKNNN